MSDISDLLEEGKKLESGRKFTEAISAYSKAIIEAVLSSDTRLSEILNLRGISKRMIGAYDDANSDYILSIMHANDDKQVALAHINIADINRVHHNNMASAHSSLDEALRFAKNGSFEFLRTYDQRGLVYKKQENTEGAIASYKNAIQIFEESIAKTAEIKNETKDAFFLYAKILHQLGVVYLDTKDSSLLDEVEKLEQKSLDIFTKLGNNSGIMNSKATIGNVSRRKYDISRSYIDLDNSITSYEAALKAAGSEDGRAITSLSLSLAEAYLLKNDAESAEKYVSRFVQGVLKGELTMHDIGLEANTFLRFAEIYHKKKLEIEGLNKVEQIFSQVQK